MWKPILPGRILTLVVVALGITLLALLLIVVNAWHELNEPLPVNGSVSFEVQSGSSLTRITAQLAEGGWLDNSRLFYYWARLTGRSDDLQAGSYELTPGMTPRDLLDMLVSGSIKEYQLTLVEGWTFAQALEVIQSSPGIETVLQGASAEEIARSLGMPVSNPEGLLFPDTYNYNAGTLDREILQRAFRELRTRLYVAWAQRRLELPLEDAYDALILASIVEKETGLPEERPEIAGVFVRRLEQGMRLQSDPTVIYGMGDRYEGNIDRQALNETTAYNTYRINGLPPTPIALVGEEAIRAVVSPAPGYTLYFVSRGDGSHQFSATLEEHNAAVRQYQLGQQ